MSTIEKGLPKTEISVPTLTKAMSTIEKGLPKTEINVPTLTKAMSTIEKGLPKIKNALKKAIICAYLAKTKRSMF